MSPPTNLMTLQLFLGLANIIIFIYQRCSNCKHLYIIYLKSVRSREPSARVALGSYRTLCLWAERNPDVAIPKGRVLSGEVDKPDPVYMGNFYLSSRAPHKNWPCAASCHVRRLVNIELTGSGAPSRFFREDW